MPFLQAGDSAVVTVPAGQSIRVGAYRNASASVLIPSGLRGGPSSTVTDGAATFGSYPAGATLSVVSSIGDVEYVVGASPVLTDQPVNPAAVAFNGGAINGTSVGATTPSTVAATTLSATGQATLAATRVTSMQSALTDGSGTPGNVTQNVMRGRAAFAAAGATVVVTNSQVAANSTVVVTLGGNDATLTNIRVTPAAGSFTVTGNASATGITPFDYIVVQN